MNQLEWDFVQQQKHNRDGSYATQAARHATLSLSARQLAQLGYRNLRVGSVGQRHLKALVARWRSEGISDSTMKNRLSHLRWSCEKAGRAGVGGITNDELGISRRTYVAKESKARDLPSQSLEKITDKHVQLSLRLQAAFGLRREESIKFIAELADRENRLELRPSWTKGGRARTIPIRTPDQRALVDEIRAFVGSGSLIPNALSYKQQLKRYENQLRDANLSKMHGLRHLYAQKRYLELTGRLPPAWQRSMTSGHLLGPEVGWLGQVVKPQANNPVQALGDREARQIISRELGHERVSVTSVYLGSARG